VHNSILEYESTASILKSSEKKFLKKCFSSQISSKLPSPQETEQKKVKEKEKLQESLQIKEMSIFGEEKNSSTSKVLFDVIPFSPPPSYHFKNCDIPPLSRGGQS
jgi:hypothetical protein